MLFCPHCRIEVEEDVFAGQVLKCPQCKGLLRAPGGAVGEPLPPPIGKAAALNPFRSPDAAGATNQPALGAAVPMATVASIAFVAVICFAGGWGIGRSGRAVYLAPAKPAVEEMQFLEVAELERQLPDCSLTGPQIMVLMKTGNLEAWRELQPEVKLWGCRFLAAMRHPEKPREFQARRARGYLETMDLLVTHGTRSDKKPIADQAAECDKITAMLERAGPDLYKPSER